MAASICFAHRSSVQLLCQLCAQQQCSCLFLRKHYRWQTISFHYGITNANASRLRALVFQSFDITVYGTQAQIKTIRPVVDAVTRFTLQVCSQNSVQSINAIHRLIVSGYDCLIPESIKSKRKSKTQLSVTDSVR